MDGLKGLGRAGAQMRTCLNALRALYICMTPGYWGRALPDRLSRLIAHLTAQLQS